MTANEGGLGFDVDEILGGLKAFQHRTVEYCFRRMYLDESPTPRMLVADEVGLGKTMVARGIIARTIEHLRNETETRRIDVVYVCSNAAIARQNVNRLNIFRNDEFEVATRLTLLPIELRSLASRDVNFVSFTPSTTFDLKSRGGMARERMLLFYMLRGAPGLRETGLRRLLRGKVGAEKWKQRLSEWDEDIEEELHDRFLAAVEHDRALAEELRALTHAFDERTQTLPPPIRNRVYAAIGVLRALLARVCVDALEPDLIILDEFQRFRDLLSMEEPSEAALLAQALMGFRDADTHLEARVLLLSATPYRMFTSAEDEEDDHHEDFLATMRFLLGGNAPVVDQLKRDLAEYRRALYAMSDGNPEEVAAVEACRTRVEGCLRSVMVRTERVGATRDRDAMLLERPTRHVPDPRDLVSAASLLSVARAVESRDVVHYWKASPYVLNFMRPDGYQLKKKLIEKISVDDEDSTSALRAAAKHLLDADALARYDAVDPGNARMRALVEETVSPAQAECLWIPPSLPYVRPRGRFAAAAGMTKSLVFSAWQIVPDAIASICSYEAERVMLAGDQERPAYGDLHEKRSGLLQYRTEKAEGEGRLGGMMTAALFYPCRTLARIVDPLSIAVDRVQDDVPPTADVVRAEAAVSVRAALRATGRWPEDVDGKPDRRWYWAALGLLDHTEDAVPREWVRDRKGWRSIAQNASGELGEGFRIHLKAFSDAFDFDRLELGAPPADLVEVLVGIALAAPGVCSLRALGRIASADAAAGEGALVAAATLAEGLRSLFNQPTAMAVLRGKDTALPYWQHVLEYAHEGDLQSVLDEYVHVLREATGHGGRNDDATLRDVAVAAAEALSLRTSRVGVDDVLTKGAQRPQFRRFNVRTRFALRFGDLKDDSGQVLARAGGVRQAFNSPFPPFVLASTSIGQEGLDFHCYCHRLYHWNLPSNPVDLEQREGRIQRFKGHAVRRNVARDIGLAALRSRGGDATDPWQELFGVAAERVDDSAGELIPFWLYEGNSAYAARVERRVPMLAMSREIGQLRTLKRGLALYRLAFGQPRQEEMLEYLGRHDVVEGLAPISLSPIDFED